MLPFHGMRGAPSCQKCTALKEGGEKYCLIGPPLDENMAAPMMDVGGGGRTVWDTFLIEKTFDTDEDAREYAKENGVQIVEKEQ